MWAKFAHGHDLRTLDLAQSYYEEMTKNNFRGQLFHIWLIFSGTRDAYRCSILLYPSLCWNDDQHKEPMINAKIIQMGN